jgi:divinyl protochlorophyllide a 8-vinyl-reductase
MHAARIGPNAITRVAEALRVEFGEGATLALFSSAGLAGYLERPPEDMVEEVEVARLHKQLRNSLGGERARSISREAGLRTGDYLLARRIPKPVQWLLRHLPAALAARVLLSAISRNSWTFAGSGTFTAVAGNPVKLSIAGNPLCRDTVSEVPVCDYYAATFERLFTELVHRNARVVETACEATGADACRFEVRW